MAISKIFLTTILFGLFAFSISFAGDPTVVEDFTLKNYDGKSYTLSDTKDAKAIVIMFIATRCPVSNAYNERMVKLYEDYASTDVVFLAINSICLSLDSSSPHPDNSQRFAKPHAL